MQFLIDKVHTSKDGYRYTVQLIEENKLYQGKILIENRPHYESSKAHSEANVKRWLNQAIDKLNIMQGVTPKIPNVRYTTPTKHASKEQRNVTFESKPDATKDKKPMVAIPVINIATKEKNKMETENQTQAINAKIQHKKTTSRKPFTPYGLNGYFVDKQGNVRLMLDRRANAKTITLSPDMFSSLAEMVRKTQEQHNELLR